MGTVFDTAASNSGRNKGAAKLIEDDLGRKLLWLACRHHIFELMIGAVWQKVFGDVSAPEYTPFKVLKSLWSSIDKTAPYTLSLDETEPDHTWLIQLRERTLTELNLILNRGNEYLPRDDYREVAELTVLVLGGTLPRAGFTFSQPGAISKARWMAVNIYAIKMFMFQDQLGYDDAERDKLLRVVTFISMLYTRVWMASTRAADAPSYDLQLYHDLLQYQDQDPEIAEAALGKLMNHQWYLTQELVPLSIFSSETTDQLKSAIAASIALQHKPSSFRRGRPNFPRDIDATTSLEDLTGPQSHATLDLLGIDIECLQSPPSTWGSIDAYVKAKHVIDKLKVTNDVAERNVKMVTDFSGKITADKEQRLCLLQMVEKHRKAYPSFKKKILNA